MRLEGKTALITGAGSGMGRVAAALFASRARRSSRRTSIARRAATRRRRRGRAPLQARSSRSPAT